MGLSGQILTAFLLDLAIGDPKQWPHPVRLIGATASWLEEKARRHITNLSIAGVITTVLLVGSIYELTYWVLHFVHTISPNLSAFVSILILYTCMATRSLFDESAPILRHLINNDEESARKSLSMIVGRDTDKLDRNGILKATVETISENIVDGIIAPLFYAFLGGAPLALAYKTINTLDSMFGYKNDKYINFGWFPARLDDAANWFPARLSRIILSISSFLLGFNGWQAYKISMRDGQNHSSPNAGIPEAAVAGALGLKLGGPNYYGDILVKKPYIGDDKNHIQPSDISKCHKIMFGSSILALIVFMGIIEAFSFI